MHAVLAGDRGKTQTGLHRREAFMSTDSPAHDFLLPRLTALIDDAVAAGYAREVAVAVLIDLITGKKPADPLYTGLDECVPTNLDKCPAK